jgi:hypothetical protein
MSGIKSKGLKKYESVSYTYKLNVNNQKHPAPAEKNKDNTISSR